MSERRSYFILPLIVLFLAVSSVLAKEWGLEHLLNLFAGQSGSRVEFVEKRSNSLLRKPVVTKGILIYRENEILEKKITYPYKETYVIDGDTIRILDSDEELKRTVSLSDNPVLAVFIESFRSVLTGDLNKLRKYYSIQLAGSEKSWRMTLVPRDDNARKYVEKVIIAGSGSSVLKISVAEPSGDSSIMTLTH